MNLVQKDIVAEVIRQYAERQAELLTLNPGLSFPFSTFDIHQLAGRVIDEHEQATRTPFFFEERGEIAVKAVRVLKGESL